MGFDQIIWMGVVIMAVQDFSIGVSNSIIQMQIDAQDVSLTEQFGLLVFVWNNNLFKLPHDTNWSSTGSNKHTKIKSFLGFLKKKKNSLQLA